MNRRIKKKARMEFRVWIGLVWLKAVSSELGEFYYHLHDCHLLNKIPFRFYLLVLLVRELHIIIFSIPKIHHEGY
jgi:hypothetical protein